MKTKQEQQPKKNITKRLLKSKPFKALNSKSVHMLNEVLIVVGLPLLAAVLASCTHLCGV